MSTSYDVVVFAQHAVAAARRTVGKARRFRAVERKRPVVRRLIRMSSGRRVASRLAALPRHRRTPQAVLFILMPMSRAWAHWALYVLANLSSIRYLCRIPRQILCAGITASIPSTPAAREPRGRVGTLESGAETPGTGALLDARGSPGETSGGIPRPRMPAAGRDGSLTGPAVASPARDSSPA
jgi:hypothetical protein